MRSCVVLCWIAALAGEALGQFRRAGLDFDRFGRPIVDDNVGDEGDQRVQTFHRSWAVLAPLYELEKSELSVSWDRPREPRPGRIVFSGRIEVHGRGTEVSPGWYQGIAVLVSKRPVDSGAEVSSLPEDEWASVLGYAARDGSFAVELEGSRLERTVGGTEPHAVALELARHRTIDAKRGKVEWSRSPLPLASTEGRCEVPGPEPLVGELEWINAADLTNARHHDPAKTIHCVNRLMELGKEGALCALREYCELALSDEDVCRDPTNIDQSSFLRALPIAMLLFEPLERGAGWYSSPIWRGGRVEFLGTELREHCPLFPIMLQDDLPVFLEEDRGLPFWEPVQVLEYLDWCDANCAMRAERLRPPDDPLAALDRLMDDSRIVQLLIGENRTGRYRESGMAKAVQGPDYEPILLQGLRLALDSVPESLRRDYPTRLVDRPYEILLFRGHYWNALRESTRSRSIHWDADACRYVVD